MMRFDYADRPVAIQYGNKTVGPASVVRCDIGVVETIEIMSSRFELSAVSGTKHETELGETIIYDRAINIHGNNGCLSLSTRFSLILGDIHISPMPVITASAAEETLVMGKTL